MVFLRKGLCSEAMIAAGGGSGRAEWVQVVQEMSRQVLGSRHRQREGRNRQDDAVYVGNSEMEDFRRGGRGIRLWSGIVGRGEELEGRIGNWRGFGDCGRCQSRRPEESVGRQCNRKATEFWILGSG